MDVSQQLIASLERAKLESYWDGEYQVFLWMLYAGYASACRKVQKRWLTAQLQKLISLINMSLGFHGLRCILEEFLYS